MENKSVRFSASRKEAQKQGYRSGLELRTAVALKKARIDFLYEPRDFTFEYFTEVNNAHCEMCLSKSVYQKHTYLPDFVVADRKVVLESKGLLSAQNRMSHKILVDTHKSITFVLLLQNPNKKITKRVTYADWCDKNNVLWLSDKEDWIPKLKEIIKQAK